MILQFTKTDSLFGQNFDVITPAIIILIIVSFMQMKLLGITNVDFDVIGRLIISSLSVRYWRKSGSIMYSTLAIHRFQESQ
jgi:hypothetical protein